jgi:hypothetical protein
MADQVMTAASNLSVIVPEIWSSRYFDVLRAELPHSPLISRDYEGEIQNLGDTVHINQVPEFDDGEELAEADAAEASAVTVTQQDLVINKRVVKDFIVTKLGMLQSLPVMDKLRELAIYAILKKIEKTVIETIVPSAAAPDHQIGFVTGTTLALADFLAAKRLLDAADVPQGSRYACMGTSQANDIFNITGFTSSDFLLAGSPLGSGQVPSMLLGFSPRMTTLLGNVVEFFHSSFMTMAAQEGMNVAVYDKGVDGIRATRVNVDTLYGLKQLDNKRVVKIS